MLTLVIGRRTQGKTTLAYFISLRSPTRVIFDPRRQFKTTSVILADGSELFDLLDTQSEIIVQPHSNVAYNFEVTCEMLSEWIDENPEEDLTFLIDEARFVDTPGTEYVGLDRIIRFGNPQRVNVIFTAHRPVDIEVGIRALADYWCMFHTTQEHDLKVIRERCGAEVAEEVSRLRPREFIVWNDGEATWKKRDKPSEWNVNIAALNHSVLKIT